MTDERVEMVARALADADCFTPWPDYAWAIIRADDALMGPYRHKARAALAALDAAGLVIVPREPSEAMLAAVVECPESLIEERRDVPGYEERMRAAVTVERALMVQRWRTMLAAALSRPGEGT